MHGVFVDVLGKLPNLASVLTPKNHVIVVADCQLRGSFLPGIGGNGDEISCLCVANDELALVIYRGAHVAVAGSKRLADSQVLARTDLVTGCNSGKLRKMLVHGCLEEAI